MKRASLAKPGLASCVANLENPDKSCGEREDLPLYGILIPSPSFSEDPPGPYGAGIAECAESRGGLPGLERSYSK